MYQYLYFISIIISIFIFCGIWFYFLWDLNPQSLNSVQTLSRHEFNSHAAIFVQPLQFHRLFRGRFHFGYCLRHPPLLLEWKFSWGNGNCELNSWPVGSVGWSVWAEFSGRGFKSHSTPNNTYLIIKLLLKDFGFSFTHMF